MQSCVSIGEEDEAEHHSFQSQGYYWRNNTCGKGMRGQQHDACTLSYECCGLRLFEIDIQTIVYNALTPYDEHHSAHLWETLAETLIPQRSDPMAQHWCPNLFILV